jgi:threonyl-tRNA synthetase
MVMPMADRHNEYAEETADQLKQKNIRVELDLRPEKIGAKIRDAQIKKIPYMLVLGDKETSSKTLAVRHRSKGDLGTKKLNDWLAELVCEIDSKA